MPHCTPRQGAGQAWRYHPRQELMRVRLLVALILGVVVTCPPSHAHRGAGALRHEACRASNIRYTACATRRSTLRARSLTRRQRPVAPDGRGRDRHTIVTGTLGNVQEPDVSKRSAGAARYQPRPGVRHLMDSYDQSIDAIVAVAMHAAREPAGLPVHTYTASTSSTRERHAFTSR